MNLTANTIKAMPTTDIIGNIIVAMFIKTPPRLLFIRKEIM